MGIRKNQTPVVPLIKKLYKKLSKEEGHEWMKWHDPPEKLSKTGATLFFINLILDQGQKVGLKNEAAKHLVKNHFQPANNFWQNILDTHSSTIRKICTKGFEGKHYALRFQANKFPGWLRSAAEIIIEKYSGDPRDIWRDQDLDKIYKRLKEFPGIGDALAKLGQIDLARKYGVAGGASAKQSLKVKPDIIVRRVMYRVGISDSEKEKVVIDAIDEQNIRSEADFDAVVWDIGREFCKKTNPTCDKCHLNEECGRKGVKV